MTYTGEHAQGNNAHNSSRLLKMRLIGREDGRPALAAKAGTGGMFPAPWRSILQDGKKPVTRRMPRTLSKYADLIPLGAFAVVIGLVFLFARERSGGVEREQEQAHSAAELRASALADEVSNQVSTLLGALVAARLRFTSVEDSVAEATFLAALDSVVSSA